MPANSGTVVVRGLAELQRAFAFAGKEFSKDLREDLKQIAEPIRADAERRAAAEIRNLAEGDPWDMMRIGVTRTLVYVAPKQRGRQSRRHPNLRRPNLGGLLMDRAMQPALDAHVGEVAERFEMMLGRLGENWERI